MSKKINLLPEHIIDQIKAGEVIERPSTLIKEIIENSIDAKANYIQIQIINNGMDLIALEDDGEGIDFENLPLAFARHATSKLERFEDLYDLFTYGFRGEALASIASISRVTCESTTSSESTLFKISGGETLAHSKLEKNSENGTKLYIKDLFFNTPVRVKFLQSKTSEKNQINKILNSFLLTHPKVKFSIKWDDLDKIIYPPVEDISKRIQKVFFKKGQDDKLLPFEQNYDGIKVKGYLSYESSRGNANKKQYIFINERFVQDIAIHKILLHNAIGFWPLGEVGSYVVYIELSPEKVDVNVHPNKTVVKMFEASKVQSIISGALKKSLKSIHTANVTQETNMNNSHQENFDQSPVDFFHNLHENDHTINFKPIHYKTIEESLSQNYPTSSQAEIKVLGDKFALYQNEDNKYYVINLNKLIMVSYQKALASKKPSTPLLISTPYKDPKKNLDHLFEDFSQMGLELDRLDNTTVAIRSVPAGSGNFSHSRILQMIADQVSKPKTVDNFISEIEKINTLDLNFTSNSLLSLFLQFDISFLIKENIIKELDEKNLRKLFL